MTNPCPACGGLGYFPGVTGFDSSIESIAECIRCDGTGQVSYLRWRFIEINSNIDGRFLAVQREGFKPVYETDWHRYESLAAEDGLFDMPINAIGNRQGDWHDDPIPLELKEMMK